MKRMDVFGLTGGIFTGVGGIIFGSGVWMWLNREWLQESPNVHMEGDMSLEMMAFLFLGLGGLSLALGVFLLVKGIRTARHRRWLMLHGRAVWAEVIQVKEDWSVRVNGAPLARVVAVYDGRELSEGGISWKYMDGVVPGALVRAYLGTDAVDYVMDLESVLKGKLSE